jgi:hypothetical protein
MGFPNTRTKMVPNEKKIKPQGFRLGTKIEKELCNNTDLVLQYEIKNMRTEGTDTYSKGPDPEGLSGCGIWFIKSMIVESMSNVDVRFCGILRQYVREENLIYANKTKVINDMFQKLKLK